MKQTPTITIAICTYNRADYLADTLRDLATQNRPELFTILVVDNNSDDDTEAICSRFRDEHPGIRFNYVKEQQQGLSYARNRAMQESMTDWVLFIDDDVIVPPHFAGVAAAFVSEQDEPCCAGGRIFVKFDDAEPDWIPSALMPMFGHHDLGDRRREYPATNFPRGGNMLIHKSVMDDAGEFDPQLGRSGSGLAGSEEKAFFEKARRHGVTLWYLPDLNLWHRISKKRLEHSYLKKQSIGIGRSERLRLDENRSKILLKTLSEFGKLGVSLLLSLWYLLRLKPKAAKFILDFRVWVMKGFFYKK